MKNVIEFVKKYKIHILTSLLFIFTFKSCIKSNEVKKLNKNTTNLSITIDSLNKVIVGQRDTINNISDVIAEEKLKVHRYYDDYISSKDRDNQLRELHRFVKNNINKLQK